MKIAKKMQSTLPYKSKIYGTHEWPQETKTDLQKNASTEPEKTWLESLNNETHL